jgi:hypothetical protein
MSESFNRKRQIQEYKTQQEVYDELRNHILEQVAVEVEKMQGFGKDTLSSFGIFIRGMKK